MAATYNNRLLPVTFLGESVIFFFLLSPYMRQRIYKFSAKEKRKKTWYKSLEVCLCNYNGVSQ